MRDDMIQGEAQQTASGWTPHNGGPCPVDPETIVRVKNCLGDRTEIHGPGLGQHMDWGVVEFYRPEPNWREIADELAEVLEDYFCEDLSPSDKAIRASKALTTYNQARERAE